MTARLALVGLCLAGAATVAPASPAPAAWTAAPARAGLQSELGTLERRLRDPEERDRREAVQGLAELATAEAWELVLDALADPHPMVADEAQLALAGVRSDDVIEELFGKRGLGARDELLRRRVAEALGRLAVPVDAELLAKRAGDKDGRVRRLLAWSVERLARAGHVAGEPRALRAALEKLRAKDRDGGVRAAALLALAALAPEEPGWAGAGLADDDPAVQVAGVLAAASAEPPGIDAILAACDPGSAREVRVAAASALAGLGTPESARGLVALLEASPELRTRWGIAAELRRISGLKHRTDPRPWREWADGLDGTWEPTTRRDASSEPDYAVEGDLPVFVGMPVLSERVAFLIDLSGSIREERGDGTTRKQRVDVELAAALNALPPEAAFNVIPYLDRPDPWKERLVPATPKNVKKALAFFEGRKASGKGNAWDAIELALEDPAVDTIVLLSDGSPSGGHRWNMELIEALFAERNRFRRVAMDVVLVDPSGYVASRWRNIATASGGRIREVDL